MFYAVRVHVCNGYVTRAAVRDLFGSLDGAVFVVYETDAEREHYQGIVWWESLTRRALTDRIRERFHVTGNKQYSVKKVKDYDKYVRYLCKGPTKKRGELPDVVCHQAIDIEVSKRHVEYWDENDRLKKKAKEQGSKCIIETVIQQLQGVDLTEGKRYEVGRTVVSVLRESNRGINMFQARGIFNAVMIRIDKQFEASFIDELISKF